MPALSTLSGTKKTALAAIGGLALGALAYTYYQADKSHNDISSKTKKKKSPRQSPLKKDTINLQDTHNSPSTSTDQSDSDDMPVQRGGRKNYRAIARKEKTETVDEVLQVASAGVSEAQPDALFPSSYDKRSWSEQVEDANVHVNALSDGLASDCCVRNSSPERSPRDSGQPSPSEAESHEEVTQVMHNEKTKRSSKQAKRSSDSPSVQSEASMDSGRCTAGSTMGAPGSMSPVGESTEIEVPPFYEFECPQSIIGLIIGKKGATISDLQQRTGAFIMVQPHHYKGESFKIVSIEGTREQINACLRMIRRRFPPSRFPDLNLHPVLPPPIPSPNSAAAEIMCPLKLPEGIEVEVAVTSIVDATHFFLQQPTHPSFQKLSDLSEIMNQVYGGGYSVPGLPRPVDANIVCAASTGIGWFRALVVAAEDDNGDVLVKFLDYGGYINIQATDLKQIRSDLMNLPFQAIECYLTNVAHKDGDDRMEASQAFDRYSQNKICIAKVLGYHPEDQLPFVEIVAPYNGENVKLSEQLVREGHLMDCKTPMVPPDYMPCCESRMDD